MELKKLDDKDDEFAKLNNWIRVAIELPHDNIKTMTITRGKKFTKFMTNVSNYLNKELFGMHAVKEQLLIFLNSKLSNPNMKGCSLGLVGPPGVGKTSIARCLSHALDWAFEQISFGGMSNQDYLKGHDYTYVGSRPGEIVRCISRMKVKNGILFFDEFEKVSSNKDIVSFLLHLTDPQQNSEYRDNYLSDITVDLSNMWFIYSMNNVPEDTALRDRIFTIKVPGYSINEKVNILIKHTLPKALINIGKKKNDVIMSTDVAKYFITKLELNEDGIRGIESNIRDFINKIHFLVKHQDKDGKLNEFTCIKFNTDFKLKFPVTVTNDIIDILMKRPINKNPSLVYMYT